jgi:hypothetical protein
MNGNGLAIRFGVIRRKVWGGSRTWAGARAQAFYKDKCQLRDYAGSTHRFSRRRQRAGRDGHDL